MRYALILSGLFAAANASAAPDLAVYGECPGDVTIEVTGLDPYGTVTVVYGEEAAPGAGGEIPKGPCEGVETELSSGKRAFDLTDSDGDGEVVFTTSVSADRCGTAFHMLDLDSCELSNLGLVPEGDDGYSDYSYYDDYYDDYYEDVFYYYEWYYDAYTSGGTTATYYSSYYDYIEDYYYDVYEYYYDTSDWTYDY